MRLTHENHRATAKVPTPHPHIPHPYNDYEGVASSIAFGEPIFRESIWAIANFVSIGDTERVANLRSIFRKVMTEEHT